MRLLQLTDTHLVADPNGSLLGQRTQSTFEAVLELARAAFWPPDLILLTGDLVHDEKPETYDYFAGWMRRLGVPFFAIPGNHDRHELLAKFLDPDGTQAVRSVRAGGWHLLMLDSTIAGEDGGRLSAAQLAAVDEALTAHREPALICLHHPPVPIGSRWLDAIGLCNGDELLGTLERHEQVRCVLWGHIHQVYAERRHGIELLGSPSTCVQFRPGSREFALDRRPPGFRWLVLQPDGRVQTGVERLGGYPDPIELAAAGY